MPESRVRVLVVNPKLNVAVGIKNAIDALDGFEARSFTSSLPALEFARTTPLDAAVLDLAIRSPNLGESTVALRRLNPKIKLLLTNAPDEAVTKLKADGRITLPARARDIEPLLRELFPAPASDNRPPTPVRRPQELMTLLPKPEAPPETPPHDPAQPDPFQSIAAEEPPVPTALEGGTVREAVRALLPRAPLDESMYVVEITPLPSDTDEGQPVEIVEPPASIEEPAQDISEQPTATPAVPAAQTETPPGPDDTKPQIASPPAVFDDADADLDEPTVENGVRPAVEVPPPAASPQPEPEQPPQAAPEPPLDEAPAPPPEIKIPGQRRPVKKKTEETPAAPPARSTGAHALSEPTRSTGAHALRGLRSLLTPEELKRALVLTHEQLGTAAAALILTNGDEVLAHSGEMPTQEIEELQAVIGGDWDVRGTQARLRYITLPTSRQEYMLHTRRTENGYALSMAFTGDMPVKDIRSQSDAVASTLESIRNVDDDFSDEQPHASRLPFTAVWMLNEPHAPLTADIAQAVVLEFDRELRELGWPIHAMNVHADFVYVFCDVQTTYLASEVVADLKRISADAACARRPDWDPDELWADAYMALMPGRELGSDEVQSFLSFTRARLNRDSDEE